MDRYRIRPEAAIYYLTYSVVDWLPVFVSEATCKIITDSLIFCHTQKYLKINAFVIMPTHLHVIAFDAQADSERLIRTLADFRKYTGRQLSDHCIEHGPPCFLETLRDRATADRERRFWQPSRHSVGIQEEWLWRQKLEYLHDNPCRKGLVRSPDHWRYSSAAWYVSDGAQAADVPLTAIEW
jgi:REP element-mobilizing transposase RayT